MKAILFLGTPLFGAQYLRNVAEALGLRPIFLLKIDEYSSMPKHAIEACEHYEADVNSLEDILRAIRENNFMADVVAITSLLDETFANACAITEQFKIAGPDATLIQLTNKAIVQKIIPEFCPPSLAFNLSDISEEQFHHFLSTNTMFQELVLKPGISSGAVGISLINRSTTLNQIKQLICDSQVENAAQQNWLLQPRITGHLYSLEGYVKDSHVFFLGFSKRVRKELTEVVNEFPVDEDLPSDLKQTCQEAIRTLVNRSGYMNGYFHSEFVINIDLNTTYLIDGNMGRIAGGAIVQQLALVYGKKPDDMFKHVIDLSVFKGAHTNNFHYARVNSERTLLIYYCLPTPGIVSSVTTPENMTSIHVQVAGNGKEMPGVGGSDSAWVGFVAGFKEKVLEEIQQFVINTNKGPVQPYYALAE